ncbi:Uncharacterised protein [Mycobacterium tuberculosis]|uniref:Uncharacterized protein n=2 Tax=Mycobacterium tuberculosis TaxID=1773 RepID=A0A654TRD3_MYCTX|nr:Uncharacterised protein [Mycobacterium tuberculosis]CKQ44312.1 Uncharacterised protein [Mycobacterium tuberculosis]COZ66869.1 Uncharacterised protein [Mycobacterium tuberculosis]
MLGVGHQLDEPTGVTHAVRLGVGRERELGHHHVVTFVAGLLLGEPEAGNVWLTERRARQHPMVAQRQSLCTGNGFGGYHALCLGDVRQLQ